MRKPRSWDSKAITIFAERWSSSSRFFFQSVHGLDAPHLCNANAQETGPYFEFVPLPDGIGYHSYWIGWDSAGKEVRVPRPLDGKSSVKGLREIAKHPVYVIESDLELVVWQHVWKSSAYLPETLARRSFPRCFDKRHLVADSLPSDELILSANPDYVAPAKDS
ncbi:hypothetical protein WJ968_24595 [Achromobacter xylosoxidans]